MSDDQLEQEALTSIEAISERYDKELLELATDLNVNAQISIVEGEDGEEDEVLIAFPDQGVSMLVEEGPWTLDEIAEALDVNVEALDDLTCDINISLAPTLDDDDTRTIDHLLISILDAEGDYALFGYGWRDDEGDWTPGELARIFGVPLNAPVWFVSDATPSEEEDDEDEDEDE
jgi:hypothetical protein